MNTLVEIRGHKKRVGKIPTLLCNTSVLCNTYESKKPPI